jgi:NAD(P)-dependent dehydrogenase (short-subunit alcohol dehydrogenase family)
MTGEPSQRGRLDGKRALVVGGGRGIGGAVADRFREEGAAVVVADPRDGDVELDVRDAPRVSDAIDEAAERLGGIDTLVYNAGVVPFGGVEDSDPEEWAEAFRINVDGAFASFRAAWTYLTDGGGTILTTASGAGLQPMKARLGYCASKAALVMLTRCLALEGAPHQVRANAVCPGFVDTPLLQQWIETEPDPDGVRAHLSAMHPLGRIGSSRDVADAFVYLASDEAAWLTGVVLPVDGGLSAGTAT